MDWSFLEEEILEVLDSNGLNESTVERFDSIVHRFVIRLSDNMKEEGEFDEHGTDSEWDGI